PKLGGLGDLPAPRPSRTAPVAPRAALDEIDLPAPRALDEIDLGDLPAPAVGDLPTPKLGGLGDLPAPKLGGPGDLPAPKLGGLGDLPAPKLGGLGDLPAPKLGGPGDLPASKLGGLGDLPAPRSGAGGELPAPKGFFDDLPQPSAGPKPELPAPKGFFDDLPQPSGPAPAARPDLPAPKGFFDDLPGKPDPGKPAPPATKGFFDDLPAAAKPGAEVAPKGFFDDLPQPSRARVESVELPIELPDLGELPGPAAGTASLDLDLDLEAPELDLGPSTAPPASSIAPRASQFDDLDLSPPSAAPVRFDPPRAQPTASAHSEAPKPASGSIALTAAGDGELALELEEPRPSATTSQRLAPKRIVEKVVDEAEVARRRRRRIRLAALATVGALGLGAGGFYFYQRHAAQQEHRDEVERHLSAARSAYAAADPTHWQRASRAAKKVLELEPAQPDALGIAAESLFADAIANGTAATTQMAQGRKLLATALESNVSTPAIARAQALSALSANQADRAIAKLQPLVAAAPKDGTLALYLGWAQAARGDAPAAIQAFTDAAASAPIKVHALYGRARVKLAQNDLAAAREDFAAVLELARDHIGAQVGLAAAQPASQAQQQEADLLAILQRKDLDAGDPRAVVQAWSLAAEAARRGGRLDAARERYRKALALIANDVAALTGLAEVELRDGKLDAAGEAISKALNQSADDLHAQLVAAEVSIQHKRFDDAEARIGALARRTPPPPAVDQARIQMVTGKLLEARGRDDAAVDAYVEAAKLVGDTDLTPALAAVAKLGQLADAATAANDPARAAELRGRADQLIAGFADGAQQDPQLALTLGVAYLGTGDATKAEPWLRRAAEGRPNEADPAYQLAKALARLRRTDEAIAALRKARALAPDRAEIGLELARTYEAAGRDPEAAELYDKLITAPDAGVELRGRAGRFFARTGQLDKAAAQGEQLAAAAPTHPAGLYLKGEAALAANRPDEAAKLFRQAVDADRDPQ
ncbi:MAG: tetratricopeptide repeat protein, partial [Kofleriaceae bacterium]